MLGDMIDTGTSSKGQESVAVKENPVNRKPPRSTGRSSAFMLGSRDFPFSFSADCIPRHLSKGSLGPPYSVAVIRQM